MKERKIGQSFIFYHALSGALYLFKIILWNFINKLLIKAVNTISEKEVNCVKQIIYFLLIVT